MLSRVEHGKSFITSGPGGKLKRQSDPVIVGPTLVVTGYLAQDKDTFTNIPLL